MGMRSVGESIMNYFGCCINLLLQICRAEYHDMEVVHVDAFSGNFEGIRVGVVGREAAAEQSEGRMVYCGLGYWGKCRQLVYSCSDIQRAWMKSKAQRRR